MRLTAHQHIKLRAAGIAVERRDDHTLLFRNERATLYIIESGGDLWDFHSGVGPSAEVEAIRRTAREIVALKYWAPLT